MRRILALLVFAAAACSTGTPALLENPNVTLTTTDRGAGAIALSRIDFPGLTTTGPVISGARTVRAQAHFSGTNLILAFREPLPAGIRQIIVEPGLAVAATGNFCEVESGTYDIGAESAAAEAARQPHSENFVQLRLRHVPEPEPANAVSGHRRRPSRHWGGIG